MAVSATGEQKFRQAESALWNSVGVEPDEEWVTLRTGENVRVQVVGDGPPVLFIHGGSSSGVNFAPLVAELDGFTCVVIDRPGCGLSDPVAGGKKVEDFAEAEVFADNLVAGVLDGLGIEQAHLVSTSFGGYFAMRGAASHPGRVDHIVELTWMMGAPISHAPLSMRFAAIPGLGMLMTKIPTHPVLGQDDHEADRLAASTRVWSGQRRNDELVPRPASPYRCHRE